MATEEQVAAGQAIYTRRKLRYYDFIVHRVSNPFIWRCPTQRLVRHYNEYITANHLDVGVGTGFFLDTCRFPSKKPRIGLLDINQNTLEFASRRISRYAPETYTHNVLEPIPVDSEGRPYSLGAVVEQPPSLQERIAGFDSLGINYLLHCLPGSIASKSVALDHLKAVMNADAIVFGSTLLQGGVARNSLAKRLMEFYNRKGIFSNRRDDLEGLRQALSQRLHNLSIEVVGCAALFHGRL